MRELNLKEGMIETHGERYILITVGRARIKIQSDGSFFDGDQLVNADDLEHGKKLYAAMCRAHFILEGRA